MKSFFWSSTSSTTTSNSAVAGSKSDVKGIDKELIIAYENQRLVEGSWSHLNLVLNQDPQHYRTFINVNGKLLPFVDCSDLSELKLQDGMLFNGAWEEISIEHGESFEQIYDGKGTLVLDENMTIRCVKYSRVIGKVQNAIDNSTFPNEAVFEVESEHNDNFTEKNSEIGDLCSNIDPTDHRRRESSRFNPSGFTIPSNVTIKLSDPSLSAIGKQIKYLEGDFAKEEEVQAQDWKKLLKPKLEMQVQELTKICDKLKNRIEKEVDQGFVHLQKLEDELKAHSDLMEEKKKKLYFPNSNITVGQDGVYIGIDDIWLEYAAGYFTLDLVPDKLFPQISLALSGTRNNPSSGITIKLQIEGFKLAGDRGKGVPKLKLDSLHVTIGLIVVLSLSFDMKTNKWICHSKNFKIDIVSFKGPYGLSRSIVSMVMSLINPIIRSQLVNLLPHELGLLLKTLPSPFCVRGEFDISGTDLSVFTTAMHKSAIICELCEYTPLQVEMFYWLQKAMDRSNVIKTAADLMSYHRSMLRQPEIWEKIAFLWSQAAEKYCQKVISLHMEQSAKSQQQSLDPQALTIEFIKFIFATEDILKKRLNMSFKLQNVDGQISLNHLISFVHQVLHRLATEACSKATALKRARLLMMLERIKANYELGMETIGIISKNMDFGQLKLKAGLHAGPNGILSMAITDLLAQAPLLLKMLLQSEKNIGYATLVPFIVSFKPQESGDVFLEVYHFTHDAVSKENQISNSRSLSRSRQNSDDPPSVEQIRLNETMAYNRTISSITGSGKVNPIPTGSGLVTPAKGKADPQQPNSTPRTNNSSPTSNNYTSNNNTATNNSSSMILDADSGNSMDAQLNNEKITVSDAEHDMASTIADAVKANESRHSIISDDDIALRAMSMNFDNSEDDSDSGSIENLSDDIPSDDEPEKNRNSSKAKRMSLFNNSSTGAIEVKESIARMRRATTALSGMIPLTSSLPKSLPKSERLTKLTKSISEASLSVGQSLTNQSQQTMSQVTQVSQSISASVSAGIQSSANVISIPPLPSLNLNKNNSHQNFTDSIAKSLNPTFATQGTSGSNCTSTAEGMSFNPELPVSPAPHLVVKNEQLKKDLASTLKYKPQEGTADTIIVIIASNPHFAMIVDQAVTLKPGAELFTIAVGHKAKGWKPFGSENMFEKNEQEIATMNEENLKSQETNNNDIQPNILNSSVESSSAKSRAGCPITIQTSSGIKFLAQIPKTEITINLAAMVRFAIAHFEDLSLLKAFLETLMGGEVFEEQLVIIKIIILKITKYLLLPGLDVEININGKIVSKGLEIFLQIETPAEINELHAYTNQNNNTSNDPPIGLRGKDEDDGRPCAIKLNAELNLKDLLDDQKDLESFLKNNTNTNVTLDVNNDSN
eukprot:gene4366-6177_t